MYLGNRTIVGEEIVVGPGEGIVLGEGLVLQDCRLVLRVPARDVLMKGAVLERCRIIAKKPLSNFQLWMHARLVECSFEGTFKGNDFGSYPEVYGPDGALVDGDFRAALLDGCRVIGEPADRIALAPWPTFAIERPHERRAELASYAWPGRVGVLIDSFAMYPPATTLAVLQAGSVVKLFGGTEVELRAALANVAGVRGA